MHQQESIYELIPRPKIIPPKEPLYHSIFPSSLPPTGSTFNLLGSSFPNVSNLGGLDSLPVGGHPLRASCSTFGRPEGGYRPDPLNFIKKGHIYRQPIKILHRNMSEVRKPPVPSMRDKPIMGLSSCKNYIIENAVDAILQGRRSKIKEEFNYLNKNDYGKVPYYLKKIRKTMKDENNRLRELQNRQEEEEAKKRYQLKEEEIKVLRTGLMKRLEMLRYQYGNISHKRVFDTINSLARKERLEKECRQLRMILKIKAILLLLLTTRKQTDVNCDI